VFIPVTSVFTCNDISSAVDACVSGLGLGLFLSYVVAPIRKDGRLKYLLEKFEPKPVPVQVVYPSSKQISAKVRAFADECVARFRHVKFD
jgi:DNA-binding transcriptional LysR family regulator